MSKIAIYLNFQVNTEKAFNFYKTIFGTEFSAPFMKLKDMPADANGPKFLEYELNSAIHVALPIIGGAEIMGTDMFESMGQKLIRRNNTTLSLQVDSKEEVEKFYTSFSEDGSDQASMRDEFWGYWRCCLEKFGIHWKLNVMK